jgi:hypothetical protein
VGRAAALAARRGKARAPMTYHRAMQLPARLALVLLSASLGCSAAPGQGQSDAADGAAGDLLAPADAGDGGAGDAATDGRAPDPCVPNPCMAPHRGQCSSPAGVAVCSCDAGYHDENGTCTLDTSCLPTTCGGHGACSVADGGASVSCACDPGWAPPFCSSCADGWHPDGAGGCTTDPCLPDPCTAPHQTTCSASGGAVVCACDPGYHDDGAGHCTNDPCTPNPCAATNQSCQVVGGAAQCYTPTCDDGNPCTTDSVVMGACMHSNVGDGTACSTSACVAGQTCQAGACAGGAPVSCDDGDPCTSDSCDATSGCAHAPRAAGSPCDDGIACTSGDACTAQGACAGAVTASCAPSTCNASQPLGAIIDIPVARTKATITLGGAPLPATNEYGTGVELYLVSKDTGQWHTLATFSYNSNLNGPVITPRVVPGVYDVYYCHACSTTSGGLSAETDATDAFPKGLRVLQSNVVVGAGSNTLNIDIPVAQTSATITLGGAPLPATNEYGTGVELYLVSKDTNQWHTFATFSYNSNLNGPTVTPRLVPGAYDIYYCHACSTASGGISAETDGTDAFPKGLRILQSNVTLNSGVNPLNIDIPVAQTSATITLGGAPLPATNEYGTGVELYLVSKDTSQWHTFATFSYNSNLNGPTVTPRLVPGAYDIYYCHACSTASGGISAETDGTDAFPKGLRILQSNVTLNSGVNALSIDIPVAQTSATITLGGAPLPATNEYGTGVELYLVSKDTNQWHTFATFSYNSNLNGPTVTPRLVPGAYDIYYCHACSTASGGISAETDSTDAFPKGLRILQGNVTLTSGVNALSIDIPVAQTSATITLGGAPLPAANEYGTGVELYLVSKDTNQWHTFATFSYNSNLNGPTVTPRLVPGAYDIYYCHACSTASGGISAETDGTDAFPKGLRILQSNVTLNSGANPLSIDIPVKAVMESFTLAEQSLPPTNEYGTGIELYLVSRDTNQWHTLATFSYNSNLNGPTVTPRIVPGVYDIYYCHACSTASGGISAETDATDAYPKGLRVLGACVTLP